MCQHKGHRRITMDGICGMNPLGQNPALSGFSSGVPTLDPNLGLASLNRLGGLNSLLPGASGLTGSDPATQALLQQSMQMNGLMLQMMQLLLGLMGNKLGGDTANAAAAGGADSGGVSSVGGGGGGGGSTGAMDASAANGKAPANDTSDQGEIKSYIKQAAAAYGADADVLTKIAEKESGFKANAVNNWDSNAKKGTPSKGMFQFIESTFKSYATEAKKANPGAWAGLGELNWLDWRQQALACAWAITHGKGSAWATYKAAGGK
ncbi:MAG: transglycosylase SLT domain-containing protein [Candidatus Eremiobacteraeota bacterium]|nr:transglycosylase SLT domain-containing protein [Candidatus Eremiobacteraeota bacterium]MCW5872079.1 transglycosylase SLT domain-containing protein [Candidatus Eremiobacteraeota bacterium]